MTEDNRYAPRYRYHCYATVKTTGSQLDAHLVNVSSTGVLLAILDEHQLKAGESLEIAIHPDEGDPILLVGVVIHSRDHYVGLECSTLNQAERVKLENLLDSCEND